MFSSLLQSIFENGMENIQQGNNTYFLEVIKAKDKNGTPFSAYILCNEEQKKLLNSKNPINTSDFKIIHQKKGEYSEQEHKEVVEFFEKSYLNKPLPNNPSFLGSLLPVNEESVDEG